MCRCDTVHTYARKCVVQSLSNRAHSRTKSSDTECAVFRCNVVHTYASKRIVRAMTNGAFLQQHEQERVFDQSVHS